MFLACAHYSFDWAGRVLVCVAEGLDSCPACLSFCRKHKWCCASKMVSFPLWGCYYIFAILRLWTLCSQGYSCLVNVYSKLCGLRWYFLFSWMARRWPYLQYPVPHPIPTVAQTGAGDGASPIELHLAGRAMQLFANGSALLFLFPCAGISFPSKKLVGVGIWLLHSHIHWGQLLYLPAEHAIPADTGMLWACVYFGQVRTAFTMWHRLIDGSWHYCPFCCHRTGAWLSAVGALPCTSFSFCIRLQGDAKALDFTILISNWRWFSLMCILSRMALLMIHLILLERRR